MAGVGLDYGEYNRWMRSAYLTLDSARRDKASGDHVWACFKAHQAAEKALKAILWGIGEPTPGHSLVKLLNTVQEKLAKKAPEKISEAALKLSRYYIPTRYPDVWSEGVPEEYYSASDSEEAVELAERMMEWVEETWRGLERGD